MVKAAAVVASGSEIGGSSTCRCSTSRSSTSSTSERQQQASSSSNRTAACTAADVLSADVLCGYISSSSSSSHGDVQAVFRQVVCRLHSDSAIVVAAHIRAVYSLHTYVYSAPAVGLQVELLGANIAANGSREQMSYTIDCLRRYGLWLRTD